MRKALLFATLLWVLIFAALLCIHKAYSLERTHHQEEFNWAIQGQDAAIDGCPGQYPEYAEGFLIFCWGTKVEPTEPPICPHPTESGGFIYCTPKSIET